MTTLADYITRHLRVPFFWGENDCVTFAARWVEMKTGNDQLSGLPRWRNQIQAHRVIRSVGGLEKAIDARLHRVESNFAKDGDIALVNGCVVIHSGHKLVGPGESGLKFISRMEAECSWSV